MFLILEITKPGSVLYFNNKVDSVIFNSSDGEIGILPGHQPLMTTVLKSRVCVKEGENYSFFNVRSGFVRVLGDTVSIIEEDF